MTLRWTERARLDLEAIGDFIARDDPAAARRWIARLQARARRAAKLPGAGRLVPEWRDASIREVLLRTYRIIYRVRGAEVMVLTVVEGHRQLPPRPTP